MPHCHAKQRKNDPEGLIKISNSKHCCPTNMFHISDPFPCLMPLHLPLHNFQITSLENYLEYISDIVRLSSVEHLYTTGSPIEDDQTYTIQEYLVCCTLFSYGCFYCLSHRQLSQKLVSLFVLLSDFKNI